MRGWRYMLLLVRFQSTLPTRGSDHEFLEQSDAEWVSIHAPHEGERRLSSLRVASYLSCFNPRSPRGGATLISGASSSQTMVSIHAPHEGERRIIAGCMASLLPFQSTLPTRGSDSIAPHTTAKELLFQSTLPTRGSDVIPTQTLNEVIKFQSTLPTRGSDTYAAKGRFCPLSFNPRSPRGGATAEKCICMQHFREFTEYYPLRHGDACCIAPQDCIIQAFFGAKKRCFYVRLCFALKNKGVRG